MKNLFYALLGIVLLTFGCQKEEEQSFPSISEELTSFYNGFTAPTLTTRGEVQTQFPLDEVTIDATAIVFNHKGEPIEEIVVEAWLSNFSYENGIIGSLHLISERSNGYKGSYLYNPSTSAETLPLLVFSSEASYLAAKAGDDILSGAEMVLADAERLRFTADGDLRNWDHFPNEIGAYVGAIVLRTPLPDQTHNMDQDSVLNIMNVIGSAQAGCEWNKSGMSQICPCNGEVGVDCRSIQPNGHAVTVNGKPVYSIGYVANFVNCCRTCGSMAASFGEVEVHSPTNATIHGIGSIYGTKSRMHIDPAVKQKTVRIVLLKANGITTLYEQTHWTNIPGKEVEIVITAGNPAAG